MGARYSQRKRAGAAKITRPRAVSLWLSMRNDLVCTKSARRVPVAAAAEVMAATICAARCGDTGVCAPHNAQQLSSKTQQRARREERICIVMGIKRRRESKRSPGGTRCLRYFRRHTAPRRTMGGTCGMKMGKFSKKAGRFCAKTGRFRVKLHHFSTNGRWAARHTCPPSPAF